MPGEGMMPDVFQVSGDEILFGPWTVGTLDPRMPATVRERVIRALMDITEPRPKKHVPS